MSHGNPTIECYSKSTGECTDTTAHYSQSVKAQ